MNIVSMCFILFFASVHTSTLHSASFSIFFSWLNNKIARLTFIIHEPTQSNSSEDGFRQKVALSEALLAEVGKINPDVDRTADMINSGESILH